MRETRRGCSLLSGILLITDGQANVGLRDTAALCKLAEQIHSNSGPTVSAFGIGMHIYALTQ